MFKKEIKHVPKFDRLKIKITTTTTKGPIKFIIMCNNKIQKRGGGNMRVWKRIQSKYYENMGEKYLYTKVQQNKIVPGESYFRRSCTSPTYKRRVMKFSLFIPSVSTTQFPVRYTAFNCAICIHLVDLV